MSWTEHANSVETITVQTPGTEEYGLAYELTARQKEAHVTVERVDDSPTSEWTVRCYAGPDGTLWSEVPAAGPFRRSASVLLIDFNVADVPFFRFSVVNSTGSDAVSAEFTVMIG
jgi:hypothetical protein